MNVRQSIAARLKNLDMLEAKIRLVDKDSEHSINESKSKRLFNYYNDAIESLDEDWQDENYIIISFRHALLLSLEDETTAREHLNLIRLNSANARVFIGMAEYYLRRGKLEDARICIKRAMKKEAVPKHLIEQADNLLKNGAKSLKDLIDPRFYYLPPEDETKGFERTVDNIQNDSKPDLEKCKLSSQSSEVDEGLKVKSERERRLPAEANLQSASTSERALPARQKQTAQGHVNEEIQRRRSDGTHEGATGRKVSVEPQSHSRNFDVVARRAMKPLSTPSCSCTSADRHEIPSIGKPRVVDISSSNDYSYIRHPSPKRGSSGDRQQNTANKERNEDSASSVASLLRSFPCVRKRDAVSNRQSTISQKSSLLGAHSGVHHNYIEESHSLGNDVNAPCSSDAAAHSRTDLSSLELEKYRERHLSASRDSKASEVLDRLLSEDLLDMASKNKEQGASVEVREPLLEPPVVRHSAPRVVIPKQLRQGREFYRPTFPTFKPSFVPSKRQPDHSSFKMNRGIKHKPPHGIKYQGKVNQEAETDVEGDKKENVQPNPIVYKMLHEFDNSITPGDITPTNNTSSFSTRKSDFQTRYLTHNDSKTCPSATLPDALQSHSAKSANDEIHKKLNSNNPQTYPSGSVTCDGDMKFSAPSAPPAQRTSDVEAKSSEPTAPQTYPLRPTVEEVRLECPSSSKPSATKTEDNGEFGQLPERRSIKVNGEVHSVVTVIGRGGSSTVYEATNSEGGTVAIKVVSFKDEDAAVIASYKNEVGKLLGLQGTGRVIRLYDYEINSSGMALVMERAEGDFKSLHAYLIKKNEKFKGESENRGRTPSLLPAVQVVKLWREMVECVQALHENGVIHLDLKPSNFVLVKGILKLIDLGISHSIPDDMTSVTLQHSMGTVDYMSPEQWARTSYSTDSDMKKRIGRSSDVWALGCILHLLMFGKAPLSGIHIIQKMQQMMNSQPLVIPEYHSLPKLKGILELCLQKHHVKRPTVSTLLKLLADV